MQTRSRRKSTGAQEEAHGSASAGATAPATGPMTRRSSRRKSPPSGGKKTPRRKSDPKKSGVSAKSAELSPSPRESENETAPALRRSSRSRSPSAAGKAPTPARVVKRGSLRASGRISPRLSPRSSPRLTATASPQRGRSSPSKKGAGAKRATPKQSKTVETEEVESAAVAANAATPVKRSRRSSAAAKESPVQRKDEARKAKRQKSPRAANAKSGALSVSPRASPRLRGKESEAVEVEDIEMGESVAAKETSASAVPRKGSVVTKVQNRRLSSGQRTKAARTADRQKEEATVQESVSHTTLSNKESVLRKRKASSVIEESETAQSHTVRPEVGGGRAAQRKRKRASTRMVKQQLQGLQAPARKKRKGGQKSGVAALKDELRRQNSANEAQHQLQLNLRWLF